MALLNLVFNVRSITIYSFADAGNSNITRLPILVMSMACQDFIFYLSLTFEDRAGSLPFEWSPLEIFSRPSPHRDL
jgi:hypothetical protein